MAKGERTVALAKKRTSGNVPRMRTNPVGQGGDRSWLSDGKPCPGVEKPRQRAISVANVDVFASGLRLHGAQFGIGEGAGKREHPADDPRQIDQPGRADSLHHLGRNQKDAAANDGADDDRSWRGSRPDRAKARPNSVLRRGCVMCGRRATRATDWNYTRRANVITLPISTYQVKGIGAR